MAPAKHYYFNVVNDFNGYSVVHISLFQYFIQYFSMSLLYCIKDKGFLL